MLNCRIKIVRTDAEIHFLARILTYACMFDFHSRLRQIFPFTNYPILSEVP